jgi:glycosyltransferase involved in cell wall biosynthesis
MRILHLVPLADPGGAFGGPLRVALNQAAELNRRGHDTVVAGGTFSASRQDTVDGQPVTLFRAYSLIRRFRFGTLVSPRQAWWLVRHVRRFDVVHVHAGRDLFSQLILLVAVLTRTTFVVQTHGMVAPDPRPFVRVFDRLVVQPLLRRARAVLVLTSREEAELEKLSQGRVTVARLPNGVPRTDPPAIPERVDSGVLEVLFLARLHPRKRPLAFVSMAAELLDRGLAANFVLIGPDEGCLAEVQTAISELSLGPAVRYEGALPMSAVHARLAGSDVYVLPSVDEPFPMSLLEAMSVGVPSVCTASCGIADLLIAESAALVVEDNVTALVDGVERLLRDGDERARLAATGQSVVASHFSVHEVVTRLVAIYATVQAR